jgi:serine/threonine protein kinase
MTTPEFYTITAALHEGPATTLHRGVRLLDGAPVLIKTLRADAPSPREVERLRHEYATESQLDSPYVIKPYALEMCGVRPRLIVEDFGGQPLACLLGTPVEIGRILDIAIEVARALADIHRQGIVHKDINPAHILVHPRTGAVKLADFGIAAHLAHFPTAS